MIRRLLLAAAATAALTAPAAAETIAVTNARIHTLGPAGDIASGTVVIQDGRIVALGAGVTPPADARVIDGRGKVVTPGFVAVDTSLTLAEVEQLEETQDDADGNPRQSAAFDVSYGIDLDSPSIPLARRTGITRAVVTPTYAGADDERGLVFAGQAALVRLGGPGDPVLRPRAAMVVDLGESGAARSGGARGGAILAIRSALADARLYARNRAAFDRGESRPFDLSREDLEALIPVATGEMPLMVRVNKASDIRQVLRLAREEKLKLILSGVREGWMVAGELAAAGVPVILDAQAALPERFESRATTLENAARLNAAGVSVSIVGSRDFNNLRQARFNAGLAVGYGLPYPAALAALTVNPARAWGFPDAGALEIGRTADLVVWDGDPLELSSAPTAVIVGGVEQSLRTRSDELRDRYRLLNQPYPAQYR